MELKQINGYTDYFIGSDGFVYRRLKKNRGLRKLKGMPNSGGYKAVQLWKDGEKSERFLVHRLVALYFIPNPEEKPEVDHINGNRIDNRVENLRWATRTENSNNRHKKEEIPDIPIPERRKNAIPLHFEKDGVDIFFKDQYVDANFFDCSRNHLLSAAKRGETFYGFSISQQELYNLLH